MSHSGWPEAPELWRAETGTTEPASFKIADGRTTVPLQLEPWGTVFVVFRQTDIRNFAHPAAANGNNCDHDRRAMESCLSARPRSSRFHHFGSLSAWSQNNDAGVKYFSGIGTYTRTVQASRDWFKKGSRLWIDLGDVKNLAM